MDFNFANKFDLLIKLKLFFIDVIIPDADPPNPIIDVLVNKDFHYKLHQVENKYQFTRLTYQKIR